MFSYLLVRHPLPSVVAGRPEAAVPGRRTANHPAPHRGLCPGAEHQGDPDHRLLSGSADGTVRLRHATAVRWHLHSVSTNGFIINILNWLPIYCTTNN